MAAGKGWSDSPVLSCRNVPCFLIRWSPAVLAAIRRWFDDNILELGREMRLSYLPPLMVYVAAGVSG